MITHKCDTCASQDCRIAMMIGNSAGKALAMVAEDVQEFYGETVHLSCIVEECTHHTPITR
jgi:uncharacterized protein YoaH (UPF0181 family)